ncbi:hypothetical protein [Pseudomonas paracarnis]|uniref:hypothetical protein n=1 Tax=Pseudomonas paracarnis TaxID=2750625 RepID=UPI002FDFBE93
MPTVNLVVGADLMRKYLPKDFERFAGVIEYSHFKNVGHLIVCMRDDESNWPDDLSSEKILYLWMLFIDWTLQDSWLVKDNCFICEIAYCRLSGATFGGWSSNSIKAQASAADGNTQSYVTFDEEDLKVWEQRSLQLRTRLHETGYTIFTPVVSKETSRFARFLSFVQIARCSSHPAMKIAQMCSALESLFSTTTTELTHRLSERVAFFLGGPPHQMESNYQLVKKAYSVRSQITHGAHISKATANFAPELSGEMFKLLRGIAFKVLDGEDAASVVYGSNDFIEEYFRKRLFFK